MWDTVEKHLNLYWSYPLYLFLLCPSEQQGRSAWFGCVNAPRFGSVWQVLAYRYYLYEYIYTLLIHTSSLFNAIEVEMWLALSQALSKNWEVSRGWYWFRKWPQYLCKISICIILYLYYCRWIERIRRRRRGHTILSPYASVSSLRIAVVGAFWLAMIIEY